MLNKILTSITSYIMINKLILPEMSIILLIGIILVIDLILGKKFKIITYLLLQLGLIILAGIIYNNFNELANQQTAGEYNVFLINNGFVLNNKINFLKLSIVVLTIIIFIYAKDYFNSKFNIEYFILNLFAMLGSMLLVSSCNLFNFYFSIETISLPIYTLIITQAEYFNTDLALDITIKYLVITAIFSGILLYGLSLIYGASGGLDFKSIIDFIVNQNINLIFSFGMFLMLVGVFFKLNLFPFQLLIPKIYQSTTPIVIMLLSSLPKIAIISFLGNIMLEILPQYLNYASQILLILIGLGSMLIGNLAAIVQNNFKKMLAYSSISNVGFILLGLATKTAKGVLAANLYVVLYSILIVNILGAITMFTNPHVKYEDLYCFNGLSKKHPWISATLLILLLSMAGFPPTIGFYAKLLIIKELIATNLTWVALIAGVLSVIAFFYYLRIIKEIYLQEYYNDMSTYKLNNSSSSSMMILSIAAMLNLFFIFGLGFYNTYVTKLF